MIRSETYASTPRRPRKPTPATQLAKRLRVDPRAVLGLARRLNVDLRLLDLATRPDVLSGQPADWDACLALGIDPLTGEQLEEGQHE